MALQLEESIQVDLPIEERHDSKQMAFMVDVKQVIIVCQATKPKAKSGGKKKTKHQKATFKPLKDLISFIPFSPLAFSQMVFHHLLLTNKRKSTHMLLLHFYLMTKV